MANEPWRQCWRTPKWLFDYVQAEIVYNRWGCVDAFASREDTLGAYFMSEDRDALQYPWTFPDSWYWCNPPFRLAGKAVRHATQQVKDHGARVVMLLLARDLQASYVRDCCYDWDMYMLTPRLGYVDPRTGKEECSPTFPSMLWVSRTLQDRVSPDGQITDLAIEYLDTRPIRERYTKVTP